MPKLLCFVMSYRRSRISVAPKRLHHRRDGTGRDANERIEKKIEKVCPTPTYPNLPHPLPHAPLPPGSSITARASGMSPAQRLPAS